LFYRKLRQPAADQLTHVEHEIFDGSVELDKSDFGGGREGKRGRGAAGKVIVTSVSNRSAPASLPETTPSGTGLGQRMPLLPTL